MKAITISRVSTEEQREAGNSIPAQVERMRKYCESNGYKVVKSFKFDESAYKKKRDVFDSVIDHIKQQKEKVVVCFDKVDRLSRDIFDKRVPLLYQWAMEDKIELHFVSDNTVINKSIGAGDKFIFGVKLNLSKYYSDAISDNTKRAFEQKRRNGEITGQAPIGYKSIPLNLENRTRSGISIDPENGPIVQKAFELYSTGNYSITSLYEELKKMGLKNQYGKMIARSQIGNMLTNTFYYGTAYSKTHNTYYEHKYPRLISKDLFDKCKYIREGRNQNPVKSFSKEYIFRGLFKCQKCGCSMSPEIHKGNVYYSCTNAKGNCKRVYNNEKDLLKQIYPIFEAFEGIPQEVKDRLVNELRELNESEIRYHKQQIKRVQREYDKTQDQVDSLKRKYLLEECITKEDYDKFIQELKDKQYDLGLELEQHTNADYDYSIQVATILDLSRRIRKIFESSEIAEKRAILNYLLQNPTVKGKKLEFTMRKPYNLVLELASCPDLLRGQDSNL